LRDQTQETASLYVASGLERTCIAAAESLREIRRSTPIGRTRPITSGTSGRVLIAYRSTDEIDAILAAQPLRAYTEFSVTDPRRYRDELAAVRRQGYAAAVEQTMAGVSGISTPIFDHEGRCVAALAVSGPSARWTMERMLKSAGTILATSLEISQKFGYEGKVAAGRGVR
jgi:DNA-binding IclR family transcriptional regulator